MGSLATGIFDLISGDPTQQQQNQLGALGGYETSTGEGLTSAGAGFEQGILSGDPADIAKTLAPEIKAGQDQVQQTADQNAQFGNRSGGTNASTQGAESNERGNIINLIGQEQQQAASTSLGAGGNLLTDASGNIQADAGLAANRQNQVGQDVGGIAQGAAEIATGFADPAAAASDPYQSLYNFQHPADAPIATSETPSTGYVS